MPVTTDSPTGVVQRREKIREEHFAGEDLWTGTREIQGGAKVKGWFPGPRTLPLIMLLLDHLYPRKALSSAYVELLSRQRGEGIVEMEHESEHAFSAGYKGQRGIRTWRDRIELLQDAGFIKLQELHGRVTYVAIVHPTTAVERLKDDKKLINVLDSDWWAHWQRAFADRQIKLQEPSHAERNQALTS